MQPQRVRPLVIGLFRHNGRVLIFEGDDPLKGERFYRPLGGEIEPGELSRDALIREIREEIGAEITDLRLLGPLENLFVHDGTPSHEVVRVYDAAFVDQTLYEQPLITGSDAGSFEGRAVWKRLEEFTPDHPPLYPDGLLDLPRSLGA